MMKRFSALLFVAFAVIGASSAQAEDYTVDPVHSSMTFKVQHLGLAFIHGRFNDYSGTISIGEEPAKCSFTMSIKIDSIDTANKMRDDHLKANDYFDAAKYPTIE